MRHWRNFLNIKVLSKRKIENVLGLVQIAYVHNYVHEFSHTKLYAYTQALQSASVNVFL